MIRVYRWIRESPKQVKASNRASVIVRVWNPDNLIGVTSTTDVDPGGIELALKTAYEASAFGAKEHVPDFSPEATEPTADVSAKLASQAPVSDLLETLIATEKGVTRRSSGDRKRTLQRPRPKRYRSLLPQQPGGFAQRRADLCFNLPLWQDGAGRAQTQSCRRDSN